MEPDDAPAVAEAIRRVRFLEQLRTQNDALEALWGWRPIDQPAPWLRPAPPKEDAWS